ncbi:CopG family transcriptional regulator [Ramlibacter sp. 2FC]|uniref:ribbon-helix-helix domain-containing protein n=1 Tax=Ramlibacter sp. 2FC TaxID=2502188 RepID=UPI0010F867D3|nr:CopG family transcriptional regulator [Ramlibacter sp. 2FC]
MSSRTRLNIFIEPDHAKRLEQLAAHRGVSKSAVIAAALASFLSPDAADQREAAMAKRLDRLSRQFDRLERDQSILIETLALYVRYFLTVSIPVPEAQQEAARAQGRARYAQFIEQLARHIQRGRSLVREVHEEAFPDLSGSFGTDGLTPSSANGLSPEAVPPVSTQEESDGPQA